MPSIRTCLWFDREAQEAAEFYVSVFPNSSIGEIARYPDGSGERAGEVVTVDFELDGRAYQGLNGGPDFTFSEAISFIIGCADQAEIDHYWSALTAGGGKEGQCGWLTDRYGVSWQVVPADWNQVMGGLDQPRAAWQAMMGMRKLDIARLQAAGRNA